MTEFVQFLQGVALTLLVIEICKAGWRRLTRVAAVRKYKRELGSMINIQVARTKGLGWHKRWQARTRNERGETLVAFGMTKEGARANLYHRLAIIWEGAA